MSSSFAKLTVFIMFASTLSISIYLTYKYVYLPSPTTATSREFRNISSKQILVWNFKHLEYFDVGQKIFEDSKCEWSNCNISDVLDGEPAMKYEDYDVIWMVGMDSPRGVLLDKKPPIRKQHQLYLFFQTESPANYYVDYEPMQYFFNLTMTYRTDSDIYVPYGWFQNKSESMYATPSRILTWIEPDYLDIQLPKSVSNKTKLVAWLVSHCYTLSEREDYVTELSKHIEVDIYGACTNRNCKNDCFPMLEREYKFYLAFENSRCQDYITEKLYRSFELNTVPIVLGGADYSRFVPPKSYIDVKDFASAKDLADFLTYLDRNPVEYEKYFWWQKYYRVSTMNGYALCELCAILNDVKWPKVKMHDIQRWWNRPDVCILPYNQTLFNHYYLLSGSL